MEISGTQDRFYINHHGSTGDDLQIAKALNMPFEKYVELLLQYGAYIEDGFVADWYYFRNKEDCQRFLDSEELLPYITIMKLGE